MTVINQPSNLSIYDVYSVLGQLALGVMAHMMLLAWIMWVPTIDAMKCFGHGPEPLIAAGCHVE
jgi:hypothetical protein